MYRSPHTEDGFTLIEILVVMIIIAILMAVAVPTFLSQKSSAMETTTTANIKQVVNAVESCGTQFTNGSYIDDPQVSDMNCSNPETLIGFEKSLRQLKLQPTAPEASIAGTSTTQIELTPSAQGYIVQRVVNDSGVFVYFAEIHTDEGGLRKLCSGGVALKVDSTVGAPSPGSKTCKSGTW